MRGRHRGGQPRLEAWLERLWLLGTATGLTLLATLVVQHDSALASSVVSALGTTSAPQGALQLPAATAAGEPKDQVKGVSRWTT
ncbi:hypothetical protein [Streptomyces lunalinharesii]|uniref:Uncharacterized protein n=1 Tax=Streptomyces lunalinharesii TaxID=333384 RepID=A0ABN3RPU6_9ACTN